MMYAAQSTKRRWPKRVVFVLLFGLLLIIAATAAVRYVYYDRLKPVSSSQEIKLFTVEDGATVEQIGANLEKQGLISSAWAFRLYVSSNEVRSALQAGEYELQPKMSVDEIVAVLTHGKVATNLVTIIPGKRIDQIRERLLQDGFKAEDVDAALSSATYAGNPALVDKPDAASLEGYIYPDSYQKTSRSTAQEVITASLLQTRDMLTPDVRADFAKQGLSTYQALILASIVEREVPHAQDRPQVAQIFIKRLKEGMKLQSDATKYYFNSYDNVGLPPTPISNFTSDSLKAVANPSNTDWLYFVSGDDGTTHFSRTYEEHQSKIDQYCQNTCTKR